MSASDRIRMVIALTIVAVWAAGRVAAILNHDVVVDPGVDALVGGVVYILFPKSKRGVDDDG